MNKTTSRLVNIGLVIFSILLACAISEAGLRIAGFNPFGKFLAQDNRAIFIRPSDNPQRIYEATPGTEGDGWETTVHINSLGFRGHEYALEKPAGTYRIAIIGDSITFGNRLGEEENYPAVLESLYQKTGKSVEVLNLALGGYDTLQEVATLADIGLTLTPDLVVLGYCINDIGVASGNVNYIRRLQEYGGWIYHSRLAQFIRIFLDRIDLEQSTEKANRQKSFRETYKNFMADIGNDDVLHDLMDSLKTALASETENQPFTRDYADETHIRRLRFAFEQLHQLQYKDGERHFDVIVLIFPFLLEKPSHSKTLPLIYDIVRHEAERMNFKAIDLRPTFSSSGFENLLIRSNDGIHPNAKGHQLAAQMLFDTVVIPPD